jgi:hypothetical protein
MGKPTYRNLDGKSAKTIWTRFLLMLLSLLVVLSTGFYWLPVIFRFAAY